MLRACEFCGGNLRELARTRGHLWIGCPQCQRSWREDVNDFSAPESEGPPRPPMRRFWERPFGQYGIAAGAIALSFSVRWALRPILGHSSPFLLFTPAVLVTSWYAGVGPAIVATGFGAL